MKPDDVGLFLCIRVTKIAVFVWCGAYAEVATMIVSMGLIPQNRPYIYKVYSPLLLILCKEIRNLTFLLNIFLKKACVVFKNVLPLHPLSGTKLPVSNMKEFIERFT